MNSSKNKKSYALTKQQLEGTNSSPEQLHPGVYLLTMALIAFVIHKFDMNEPPNANRNDEYISLNNALYQAQVSESTMLVIHLRGHIRVTEELEKTRHSYNRDLLENGNVWDGYQEGSILLLSHRDYIGVVQKFETKEELGAVVEALITKPNVKSVEMRTFQLGLCPKGASSFY